MNKSAESATGTMAVDLARLDEMTGGDRELARTLMTMARDQMPDDLARIRSEPDKGALDALHRLVGTARAVGAVELAELGARVHATGRIGTHDLDRLGQACDRVRAFVADHLAD